MASECDKNCNCKCKGDLKGIDQNLLFHVITFRTNSVFIEKSIINIDEAIDQAMMVADQSANKICFMA